MVVGSGAASAKEGGEIGEKFKNMDVVEFFAQMKTGVPRLFRPLSNGLLDAAAKGDFAAGGNTFSPDAAERAETSG